MRKQLLRTAIALAAMTALVPVVGAGAGTSRGPSLTLHWQAPTPRDGAAFSFVHLANSEARRLSDIVQRLQRP